MKQSERKKRKPGSRSHAVKSQREREEYDQKVRHADSEGGTKEQIPSKTSTLSTSSSYVGSESAGIADREPFKPARPRDRARKIAGIIYGGLAAVAVIGAAFMWLASVGSQVSFNEKQISQLDTNLKEVDSKRESLNTRIIVLEQWKEVVNDDLSEIKADIKNGVSIEQVDMKLMKLEQRVLKECSNRKMNGE